MLRTKIFFLPNILLLLEFIKVSFGLLWWGSVGQSGEGHTFRGGVLLSSTL